MKRDSSGRLWLTSDVARYFGVTPAAIRAQCSEGRLRPAHVTPGGVAVFYRDEIEDLAQRRRLRVEAIARLDVNLGLRPAPSREPAEVQLPLSAVGWDGGER